MTAAEEYVATLGPVVFDLRYPQDRARLAELLEHFADGPEATR